MKKALTILSAALLLGFLVLTTGCNKNSLSLKGGEITFGTATEGIATRTEYGDYNDARSHQAINWLENDQIRIVSDQAAVNGSDLRYADYKVTGVTNTTGGGISTAEVANVGANGLSWKDGYDGAYAFYAVYPSTTPISADAGTLGQVTGTISATPDLSTTSTQKYIKVVDNKITEVASATDADYTYNAYAPDMTGAIMTAAATNVKENADVPQVSLHFKPAFTAIEVNLTSIDEDGFSVSEVSLSSETANLAGGFTMTAGADVTATGSVTSVDATHSVTLTPSSALAITDTEGIRLTFFLLPVTNTEEQVITLNVKTSEGTAKLALKQNDKAYQFQAGKKYNINFLKIGGKFTYAIALAGMPLPWQYTEESTTYSENVQAIAFDIDGALETLDDYRNAQSTIDLYGKVTSNHYEAYDTATNSEFKSYAEWVALGSDGQATYNSEHTTYYQLYYQLRTLDMDVANPRFNVTFTPMAPLGGYWNLSTEAAPSYGNTAQGGPEGFRIVVWDGESELENWSSGQIMNQKIELRIYPSATRDLTKEYCMILKSFFSPNKNGEPTYSADSELQDVHGDGRYSYWKFVIPATE